MQLGALLEDLTVAKARAGIEKLVRLTPQTARVISGGVEKIIPAGQVRVGDIIRVLPGEARRGGRYYPFGADLCQSSGYDWRISPVDKAAGDAVFSGTVNQFGAFEMRATKVGKDSSIQRMIRLVQSADAGKAKNRWPCQISGQPGLWELP